MEHVFQINFLTGVWTRSSGLQNCTVRYDQDQSRANITFQYITDSSDSSAASLDTYDREVVDLVCGKEIS